ncbi:BFD domain protein (2Fe-2S)-binding domain protein [Nitrosococcus halophilus Nc 4]|uniref:Bacterioferritin-associated ferredoxin n=1 Tax=Nitrosococcus halophilus (strain Nc4) TaxID=472759 RepID=D5C144_NITHN|nr:(2Fe-2S)-binding protein [Nitrosococcus halophilus]ADE14601.1 BFD domain protein (2Fe-2S)-binding domain protein [Nitrosococcus halophilus Nc 4]
MYVCICRAVTDKQLQEAISEGTNNLRDLRRQLGVVSSCGKCGRCVREILQQCQQAATAEVSSAA